MPSLITLFVVLSFLFGIAPALSQDFFGQVVGVIGADIIEVLHNKKAVRVRLQGIDCPENDHRAAPRGIPGHGRHLLLYLSHSLHKPHGFLSGGA